MIPIDYRKEGFVGSDIAALDDVFSSSPFKGNRVGENAWGIILSCFIITGTGAVE